jgi:predicted ArsR family transcriptional regulator
MRPKPELEEQIRKIALLDEPIRRALYFHVRERAPADVSRDEAAGAVGVSRRLAAFHLDRLVEAGLLEPVFRRLSGRVGPGAGRPSKLYRPAQMELAISLPERAYGTAARIFGAALGLKRDQPSAQSLRVAAREAGRSLGERASEPAPVRPPNEEITGRLIDVLARAGFEPLQSESQIRLRNCPFHGLAEEYRRPVCEMCFALQEGILEGLDAGHIVAQLSPGDGLCCVIFEERGQFDQRSATAGLSSR